MKQIVINLVKVVVFSIIYLVARYAVSLWETGPAFGWEVSALLGVTLAFVIFTIQYVIKPEKAAFTSLLFFIFFLAGGSFWQSSGFPDLIGYSVLAAISIFFLFFFALCIQNIKALNKKKEKSGTFLFSCLVYVLILPVVALGEMLFNF